MAELSRFFNSVTGDERTYQAEDFAQFFQNFLGNGFFEGLGVSAENTINTIVSPGSAFIEGHEYTNTTSLTLVHDPADAVHDRIDRVVLRLNKDIEERSIKAFVIKGETGASPAPPALTRNNYVYEISLAQIRIVAGKSYIDSSQITDERGNHEVCGRVQVARRVGDQINTVDIKPVTATPDKYVEGISQFYLSGNDNGDIMQGWLDSIGISAGDYGRTVSSLRAYVHTIGNRTNTGVQTITIFAWDRQSDYQIYGEFKRAHNAISDGVVWGQWQEQHMIVDQGENSNGHFICYSDGTQICWAQPFGLNSENSTGSLYTSETKFWTYPKPFVDTAPVIVNASMSALNRWVITTGSPAGDSVGLRCMSSTHGTTEYTAYAKAWGRWR